MDLFVKRLTPTAIIPTRGSEFAVGYDLHADLQVWELSTGEVVQRPVTLYPGQRTRITTGIAAAIPVGYYGRVAPRSGLSFKSGIVVLGGVLDPDYRGDISVMLLNTGDKPLVISQGDRIAQLIIEACATPDLIEQDDLPESVRGDNGFGSTGV